MIGLLASPLNPAEGAAACIGLEPGPTRTVTRIIDAETVALDDGRELRLIGALAPRAIDVDAVPGSWPPQAAAKRALRALVLGKSIALAFAGTRTDRYDRLQAQAFLIEPGGRQWVQGNLLRNGFARAYASAGNTACSEELLAAERAARAARRGLWAHAAYRIRQADSPSQLLRYLATFQIVKGRIVHVGMRRTTIYLNFARNWRRGLSASLRRRDRALLGAYATSPWKLEGRRVRVRGWIARQRSGAPIIDLSDGGLIEVLSEPPDRSTAAERGNNPNGARQDTSGNAPASLEQQQRRAGQQHGNAHQ